MKRGETGDRSVKRSARKGMAGGRFMKQVAAKKIEVGDSIMSVKKGYYVASAVITRNIIS